MFYNKVVRVNMNLYCASRLTEAGEEKEEEIACDSALVKFLKYNSKYTGVLNDDDHIHKYIPIRFKDGSTGVVLATEIFTEKFFELLKGTRITSHDHSNEKITIDPYYDIILKRIINAMVSIYKYPTLLKKSISDQFYAKISHDFITFIIKNKNTSIDKQYIYNLAIFTLGYDNLNIYIKSLPATNKNIIDRYNKIYCIREKAYKLDKKYFLYTRHSSIQLNVEDKKDSIIFTLEICDYYDKDKKLYKDKVIVVRKKCVGYFLIGGKSLQITLPSIVDLYTNPKKYKDITCLGFPTYPQLLLYIYKPIFYNQNDKILKDPCKTPIHKVMELRECNKHKDLYNIDTYLST